MAVSGLSPEKQVRPFRDYLIPSVLSNINLKSTEDILLDALHIVVLKLHPVKTLEYFEYLFKCSSETHKSTLRLSQNQTLS